MTSNYDLTTEKGLSEYLTSKGVEHSSVSILTGGTANYVYRVTLPSGETIIYKHAAPYLHSNNNFQFDPARMDYEECILARLPQLLKEQLPETSVHAVRVHSYDREGKLLCIEDGGGRHLKDAYTDPSLDIPKIGQELGKWLAAVHTSTPSTSFSLTNPSDLNANNPIGVSIYRYAYTNLHTAFTEYRSQEPHNQAHAFTSRDIDFAHQIDDNYGSRLVHENECICHGDFWPGNILLKPKPVSAVSPSPTASTVTPVDLTVVDWEMSRRGTSATDVAQFCAEAFLLDRFRGARGLLPAFLDAYLTARFDHNGKDVEKEWFRRMAVHWGVHVAFWPTRVEWTNREGTRELVDMGVGVLRTATEGRWGKLSAEEPFRGMKARFKDVF